MQHVSQAGSVYAGEGVDSAKWVVPLLGKAGREEMTDDELASLLEAVLYNETAEGRDKRGVIFGLTKEERDQIVNALRGGAQTCPACGWERGY